MLKVEKNAKTLDEALELAAQDLGVAKDEVAYTVTKEIGRGLMKFLVGSEIEILAWRKADEEKEACAPNPEKAAKPEKSKPAHAKAEKTEKTEKAEKTISESNTKTVIEEKHEKKRHDVDDDFVIPKTAVDDAKYFVSELLKKIGLTFDLHIKLDKNVINIDVSGDKMGLLIGKRGDTLDAVQMLTVLYVNRNKNMPYVKVNIDTENYRSKREETLIRLAHGLERSVLRDKKSITLEPMTANERRIIHSALQNNPRIKTHSIGEDPNRRMVVSLAKTENQD